MTESILSASRRWRSAVCSRAAFWRHLGEQYFASFRVEENSFWHILQRRLSVTDCLTINPGFCALEVRIEKGLFWALSVTGNPLISRIVSPVFRT